MKNFIKTKAPVLGIFHLIVLMAAILVAFTGCTEEDDFIAVADISGVPTVAEVNIPLTLTSTVSPSDATNKAIAWSVKNAGTTGASVSGNTMTATTAGTATLTATITNGASKNTPFTKDFSITVNDDFVAVTDISGVPTEAEVEVPLTLSATVTPTNATNQTIAWSIKDAGTTGATITEGNTLTATADGTATVTATIANGASRTTPFAKDFSITVIDDFVAVTEISDVPTETEVDVPLTLTATVTPADATNQTIEWSVKDAGTTGATITEGNILTATDEGTVTVTATIANGASRSEPFISDFTITVIKVEETGYYQGPSGYVKFKWNAFNIDNAYIATTERYGATIFGVSQDESAKFYLDKIDDTRYLIKYVDFYSSREKYMVPAIPSIIPEVDIRNIGRVTLVEATREGDNLILGNGTVIDLKKPNDYTYSFIRYELTEGYAIFQELVSDLSSFGLVGSSITLSVDWVRWDISVTAVNEHVRYGSTFFIEETEVESPYIDFGDEKSVRFSILTNYNTYLYEDGTSIFSSNTKGITYLGMYNNIQYPAMKDVFKLKKVGESDGKILYTIYSEGEGTGSGGGGYLTDATDQAFNSNGSIKNPDYVWEERWARLSFEAEPGDNSLFAFRRVELGADDFVIETASGESYGNYGSYVGLYHGVTVISKTDLQSGVGFGIFRLVDVSH